MSDDQRVGVPIAEAAEELGVTVELLRKRAQRGTIPAYKVDGRWFVVLDKTEPIVQDTSPVQDVQDVPSRTGQGSSEAPPPRAVAPAALSQLEAIRDEWLQPLVDQLKVQATQIGRLEVERDVAISKVQDVERERDELLAEVELLREIRRGPGPDQDTDPFAVVERPEPLEASPQVATATATTAMSPSSLHAPSRVSGLVRRLLGRP